MRRYMPYRKIYCYEEFWEIDRERSQTLPKVSANFRPSRFVQRNLPKPYFLALFQRLARFIPAAISQTRTSNLDFGLNSQPPELLLGRRNSFPFFIKGTKSDFCLSEIVAQSRETVHVPRYFRLTHLLRDLIQSTLG